MAEPRGLIQIKQDLAQAVQAGDRDAVASLVAEYKQRDASRRRSLDNAAEQYSALDGESGLQKFHLGMASGLTNVGRRLGQILTPKQYEEKLGVSDKDIESQATTDRELEEDGPGKWGRLVTETALTAPIGGAAGRAVAIGGKALLGARALRAAQLAAEGATQGDLVSGNAGEGAALNLGLGGLAGAAGRLIRGSKNVTPEARRLLDEGVDMTPGQMNPKGVIAQLEQGAERVPIVGPYIRQQREALLDTGAKRLLEKQAGIKVQPGQRFESAVEDAYGALGKEYDKLRANMGPVAPGGGWQLAKDWTAAVKDPNVLASPEARSDLASWLGGKLNALGGKEAEITGSDLLKIRGDIREKIRMLSKAGDRTSRDQAELLGKAEEAITKQIEHTLDDAGKNMLREVDGMYAGYKPLEQAAFQAAARPGGQPTITMLVNALKKNAGQSRWSGRGAGRNEQFARDLRDAAELTERPTGAILPAAVLGAGTSPLLALGATKTGSRLYAGMTGPQRAAARAIDSAKATPYVRTLLEMLRRGTAGALTDQEGN